MTTTQGAIWCGNLTESASNAWGRPFDLSAFGIAGSFSVQSVTFGVGEALSPGDGQQAVTVNIYDGYTTAPNFVYRGALVGTLTQQVADGTNFNLTWNVPATITTGLMYVEVEALDADGFPGPDLFKAGANSAGQTASSYLWAPACGINDPLATHVIGSPDDHMVLSVTGIPAPATASTLVGVIFLARRRRSGVGSCPISS